MSNYKYISSIPYYGGKSGRTKLGKWVASMLPQRLDCVYVELCLGMGGVWLQRDRAKVEIINDLNERVVNFWRAVRDHGEELERLMKHTPFAQDEFNWAAKHLDDSLLSVPKRALAFITIIEQNLFHIDGKRHTTPPQWAMKLQGNGKSIRDRYKLIDTLRQRVHYAQICNEDAIRLVYKTRKTPHSVLYFDPPYSKRHGGAYAINDIDKEKFCELFYQHKGAIAISGCDDEWDELGWEKHDLEGITMQSRVDTTKPRRVEHVWCNYSQEEKEQLW